MVTTGDTHLAFSHARHTCLGGVVVAAELKMILAYVFLNSEVKALIERPETRLIEAQYLLLNWVLKSSEKKKVTIEYQLSNISRNCKMTETGGFSSGLF